MKLLYLFGFLGIVLAKTGCAQTTLKEALQNDFLIGAALNPAQFCESNAVEAAIVKKQFNSISPENVLKWEHIHPAPGRYNFTLTDKYVAFGETNHMFIIGHTLVWHSQTPEWVFEDKHGQPVTREVLLQRMRDHIFTVIGRYQGRVKGWDVVNEALEGDGSLRNSPWHRIIGDDYIAKAFQFAHEADPQAKLYYNDYGLENESKRKGAVALVKRLQMAGIPIHGVGIQEHVSLEWPTLTQLDETLTAFGQLGVKTMVTELDVDVLPSVNWGGMADVSYRQSASPALNPYTNGLPKKLQQALSQRYAQLFATYIKHRDTLERVTLWGVTDGNSWLNDWPIMGRKAYPLFFDRDGKAKECFQSVIGVAGSRSRLQSASNE